MEKEDKRGIFFGVIGVLTLIVAIIGASFAYFSINARSDDDALVVKAATVRIKYTNGDTIDMESLIPSERDIALKTYRRAVLGGKYSTDSGMVDYQVCRDDDNYLVCGYYSFTLENDGENSVDINAFVVPTKLAEEVVDPDEPNKIIKEAEKPFTHLSFIMYDITDVSEEPIASMSDEEILGTPLYQGTVTYDEEGFGLLGVNKDKVYSLAGNGTTKKFRLFFWLDEAGEDNNKEQGATFKGTVHIDLAGANNDEHITGKADLG